MHEMRAHLRAKRRGPTLTHGVENPLDTLGRGRLLQCRNVQIGAAQSLPRWNPAAKPAGGERPVLMISKVAPNISFRATANTPLMLMLVLIAEHGHRKSRSMQQSLHALSPPHYTRLCPNRRS
jgi:hypothetical protein